MDAVAKRHSAIRDKMTKLLPALDEIISDHVQLQRDCDKSPPIRAVYLSRRIGLAASIKGAAGVKFLLMQLIKSSGRSTRHVEAAQTEVLAPELPGVVRDPSEVREMLRKMAKANKK
jgi:hypothetical protein